jgi:hypothetical protein
VQVNWLYVTNVFFAFSSQNVSLAVESFGRVKPEASTGLSLLGRHELVTARQTYPIAYARLKQNWPHIRIEHVLEKLIIIIAQSV